MYTEGQTSLWTPVVASSKLNQFGDATYEQEPIEIKARIQPHVELVTTPQGKEMMSRHYYYVSPPKGMEIFVEDKLDGELVVSKYVMYDLYGNPKMVRFITV